MRALKVTLLLSLLAAWWSWPGFGGGCPATSGDVEGPFYRSGAPFRANLNVGKEPGDLLRISGTVREAGTCRPIPNALLDVWHSGPDLPNKPAAYDNESREYRFRGKMRADRNGRYALVTLMPGHYPFRPGGPLRTRHIHFKVSAPGYAPLTTQLYFQGDRTNDSDPLFKKENAIPVTGIKARTGNLYKGVFNISLKPR